MRHRAQKWNVGKSFTVRRIWNKRKGTWNVLRTFEETHAISAMANSTSRPSSTTGYEKRRLETNHWRQITQGTACSRADICRSGRRFCLFEFNSRMWDIQPKKINTPKKNRHFLYGGSFALQYSFLINQHMKFLYGLRMHKLTRLRFLHQSSSQQMILTNDE